MLKSGRALYLKVFLTSENLTTKPRAGDLLVFEML